MRTSRITALLVVLSALVTWNRASAQQDNPDLMARTHFAAGEYQQALEIYAKLYAQTLHPTYLRNVGRCYQNMGRPDEAISSFREYLRKAKDLTPEARAEVEGFVHEMEDLKHKRVNGNAEPIWAPVRHAPDGPLAPPAPAEDRKERRLNAPPAWSLYFGAGGGEYDAHWVYTAASAGTGMAAYRLQHDGLVVSGGFGFRTYLTRIMGVQARGSILVGVGDGTLVGAFADATLRLGPFGAGFPIYFGLGPALGPSFLARDGSSANELFGGAVAEIGFLFGQTDRIEIALRTYFGLGTLSDPDGSRLAYYPTMSVGFRL